MDHATIVAVTAGVAHGAADGAPDGVADGGPDGVADAAVVVVFADSAVANGVADAAIAVAYVAAIAVHRFPAPAHTILEARLALPAAFFYQQSRLEGINKN